MALQLFLDMMSQPCRSVYMFAKKNNIPVEVRTVSLVNGEQFTEEFGKVNPIRKVPALKDGDFSMGESIAMMQYMVEKFKTPDHWYPAALQERARVNEYLCWQPMGIRLHGSKVFWLKVLKPFITFTFHPNREIFPRINQVVDCQLLLLQLYKPMRDRSSPICVVSF
ncbi:glutathione S-transferase theta-3-like [Eucyclogobius newberryi]|uniref:glutathione S-transferase theta-3-like n=1 Tax=Eucyclogobius newberryi TaxID=166745 RepID=UPI003B5C167C